MGQFAERLITIVMFPFALFTYVSFDLILTVALTLSECRKNFPNTICVDAIIISTTHASLQTFSSVAMRCI